MTATFDIDAYCARIGFTGPREPTLKTLQALHDLHPRAIPFENLDSYTGRPVPLDLPALMSKLVHGGRGGYCFEQNLLFRHALTAFGYKVTGLAARVLWNRDGGSDGDATPPRSHMLLRVAFDGGTRLADVGFGGMTLTGPLRIAPGEEQATPHESFRLSAAGAGLTLEVLIGSGWKPVYRFDMQEQFQADYEVSNYYVSTHPQSLFQTTFIVARPGDGKRYALRNRDLTIHHLDGRRESRVLTSSSEIRMALENELHLPGLPDDVIGDALRKLASASPHREVSAPLRSPASSSGPR